MTRRKDSLDDPSRRRILAGLAAAPVVASLGSCAVSSEPDKGAIAAALGAGLPKPEDSGVDHIVVVMMENRSFDHMLGWVPGAEGKQAGLSYAHKQGGTFPTFALSPDPMYGFQGCNWADPDHGYDGGRIQFNGGKCDGFLKTDGTGANVNDHFPIGYYVADDLPFYKGCAENWTICDRYFCGIMSATIPNRMYMHAGRTDRNENSTNTSTLETVWDRLAAKGHTGRYYAPDLPLTALWGSKYLDITRPYDSFLADAAAGQLADVTYIDPAFGFSVGEGPGLSRDDHPHADVRDGQAFLSQIYNALTASPQWGRTLLIINYDEWGGFYDHVPPPLAPVSADERSNILPQGNDGRLGFRTPCVLIGPRVKKAHVEQMQLDPNAILNLICWRFGLDPLGVRAATSGNLAHALDFSAAPRSDVPAIEVPAGPGGVPGAPFGQLCSNELPVSVPLPEMDPVARSMAMHRLEIQALGNLALRNGFVIGR
jgi:phospholipase C